jgi:hypothetical protein
MRIGVRSNRTPSRLSKKSALSGAERGRLARQSLFLHCVLSPGSPYGMNVAVACEYWHFHSSPCLTQTSPKANFAGPPFRNVMSPT